MMMNRWTVMLGVSAWMVASVWAADEGAGRVAVVNMDRLIKSHPDTSFAESVLKQQVEEFEAEQKELQAAGEKIKDEFEKLRDQTEDKALSETAREEKINQAKDKLMALKQHEQRAREKSLKRKQDLSDNELRLRKQIVGKIRDVVGKYADKNGIVLVVDLSAPAATGIESVIYSAGRIDITDEIFKQMGGKDVKSDKAAGDKKDGK